MCPPVEVSGVPYVADLEIGPAAAPPGNYGSWMGRGAPGSRRDARSHAMLTRRLADCSLAVVLGLAFIAGMGSPRLTRAHDAGKRHPHSVLTPRHGHAPRLGVRAMGRDDSALSRGGVVAPPTAASLISCAQAPMSGDRRASCALVRGPPSRTLFLSSPCLSRYPEFRSDSALGQDPPPSTKLIPANTTTRLPRRDRADRVEGAPARRTPSLAGGDS